MGVLGTAVLAGLEVFSMADDCDVVAALKLDIFGTHEPMDTTCLLLPL